jgi:hypothetical protein
MFFDCFHEFNIKYLLILKKNIIEILRKNIY